MGTEHTEARPAPLRGYRVLNDAEKTLIDEIKLCEDTVGKLWARVYVESGNSTVNGTRYALAAEDHFRAGFMELVRSVALPRDAYRENLAEVERVKRDG